jgi:salicylate hydroxylase
MGPGRHIVRYPLRDGRLINLVAVQERKDWAEEGWFQRDDPDNLRRAFADFGGPVAQVLQDVRDVHLWGLFRHPVADVWYRDGVALLGDAAHPTLPFLAQGANMALEDAYALLDCVDRGALHTYRDIRHARVSKVIHAANRNAWKYHLRHPLVRRVGHMGLSAVSRVAPGALTRSFDWLYGYDIAKDLRRD